MQSTDAKWQLGAVNQALDLVCSGFATAGFQLSGTFVGTVTFERTIDGVNWLPFTVVDVPGGTAVTSATAPGIWIGNCAGLTKVRARCSAFTSGPVNVAMRQM